MGQFSMEKSVPPGSVLRGNQHGPVAEYAGETPALLADAMMRGDLKRFAAKRVMERRTRDRAMAPIVKATGAIWVSAWDI